MLKIYIASPYTHGWQADNVKRQLDASHILMDHGYAPYTPLLTHFQEMIHTRLEKDWLDLDIEYLKVCDAVFRIIPTDNNGDIIPSKGADLEEETAIKNDIPVFHFHSIKDLKYQLNNERKTVIDKIINEKVELRFFETL